MLRIWILPTALIVLVLAPLSHAEDKAATQARLQRAEALNRLDDPAIKPWYLKASFSLFDEVGKLAEQGTLEEWWAGPALYKRTITSPSYTATIIVNKDGRFRTAGAVQTPYLLELLERQMVHPLPRANELAGATPQLQKITTDPAVDCVMANHPTRSMPFPQVGIFPTYCMVPDKDILEVSYDYGVLMAVRSALGMFQQHVMPVDLAISMNRVQALASHTAALRVATLTAADFVPPAGMEADDTPRVQVAFKEIKATAAGNAAPTPPVGAKPYAMGDPVVVNARLGTDGRVHAMRLMEAADPLVASAAMAAVLHWTYQPYMVNGKPVEVETNIPVKFGKPLGPGEGGKK